MDDMILHVLIMRIYCIYIFIVTINQLMHNRKYGKNDYYVFFKYTKVFTFNELILCKCENKILLDCSDIPQ